MLYETEAVAGKLRKIARLTARRKLDPAEGARQMLAVDASYAPAILVTAVTLKEKGELAQAEKVLWDGLVHAPCNPDLYLTLSGVIGKLRPGDATSALLTELALWNYSLQEEIAPETAKMMRPLVKGFGRATDPETYSEVAALHREEFENSDGPAKVDKRLAPFALLNDLQMESIHGVEQETLAAVLKLGASMAPLLYGAVRQWANAEQKFQSLGEEAAGIFIAMLGELGGAERIGDLLELSQSSERLIFVHAHWAIYRLGQRFPAAALATFRWAAKGATAGMRCGIAEQLNVLPAMEGVVPALKALTDDFAQIATEHDAPYLLAIVTDAMAERDAMQEAHALLLRNQALLTTEGRTWLEETIHGDDDFLPLMMEKGITGCTIQNICLEQALFDDEDDEEFDDEEDAEDLAPEPAEEKPLGVRILKGMEKWHTREDRKRSLRMFFGTPREMEYTESEIDAYFQFLLHDYHDESSGRTLIEHYLEGGAKLSAEERAEAESMRDSRFGVYEIYKIEKGRGVHLRDLFDGATFFVRDVTSSRNSKVGDCALLRVQRLDGRFVLAGDGTVVPREMLEELRSFVKTGSEAAVLEEADYVRRNGHLLRRLVADRHAFDEESESERCSANYEVKELPALLKALRSASELTEEEPDDTNAVFLWLGAGEVLGTIRVSRTRLRVETGSQQRMKRARAIVEAKAAGLVKYLGDRPATVH